MNIGDRAPEFTLKDQNGHDYRLADHLGPTGTVVFFYPKDHSGVCTAQVCAFRDRYSSFKDRGVEVVGISGDSQKSHQSFASEYRLNYPILSDLGNKVRKLWNVPKKMGLIPGRVTYVLNGSGVLLGIYDDMMHAEPHIQAALDLLKG